MVDYLLNAWLVSTLLLFIGQFLLIGCRSKKKTNNSPAGQLPKDTPGPTPPVAESAEKITSSKPSPTDPKKSAIDEPDAKPKGQQANDKPKPSGFFQPKSEDDDTLKRVKSLQVENSEASKKR